MKKFVLFAFNGESMCFVHVMLTALDMKQKGYEVKVVIEGSATALLPKLAETSHPFNKMYNNVINNNLIDSVCKACSAKMGILEDIVALDLPLGDDMKGHPSMTQYIDSGYQIITF